MVETENGQLLKAEMESLIMYRAFGLMNNVVHHLLTHHFLFGLCNEIN
jgi:hypothetical protein